MTRPVQRRRTAKERQDDFRLLRDKVLLCVGTVGVLGIGGLSVFVGVKDSTLALACLTVCAGLLGAPTAFRLDEKRRSEK